MHEKDQTSRLSREPELSDAEPARRGSFGDDLDPETTAETEQPDDIPPDGGYGWIIVLVVFLVNCCIWGTANAYAIYMAHYLRHDSFPGTSKMEYTIIGGLAIAVVMLCGPLGTAIVRKAGTKTCMLLGATIQAGALLGASFSTKKWQVFLFQAVLYGVGHGLLFIASTPVVSQWFSQKRSVANGLVTAGGGVGGLAFSLGIDAAIRNISLPWSFRISAAVCFSINATSAFLIKDRNKHIKAINQASFDVRLFKRRSFRLILFWLLFTLFGYMPILFSIADYSQLIGLSVEQAAIVTALLSTGMVIGRPFIGLLCDRWGRINVSMAATALTFIFNIVFWIPTDSAKSLTTRYALACVYALAAGAVCGTMWATISVVCVEALGIAELNSAFSIVWMLSAIPCTFATTIALALRDPSAKHPYINPQIFSTMMYIIAFFCIWGLRTTVLGERRQEAEKKLLDVQSLNVTDGVMNADEKKMGGSEERSSDEEVPLGGELPPAGWLARGVL